jgi:site-specific DNA recombinase
LGYDVVNTKLVVVPEEAERVRQIFQMYVDGEGLTWLAGQIERLGWRNKRWTTRKGTVRGGRVFDKTSLYKLLTNVVYIGKVKYKDEVHQGEHEAIVPEELWKQVQTKFELQRRTGGPAVRNRFGATLKGLLHCVPCKCLMSPTHSTRRGNKRYRYYVCTSAQKRGWQSCPSKSIPAGEIERFVVEQIKDIGRDPALIATTVRQVVAHVTQRLQELAVEERRLQSDLAACHGELPRLATEAMGGEGADLAVTRLADLQERIVTAERRLTEVRDENERLRRDMIEEADVARALTDFESVWRALNLREQTRLLRLLIERIDYDGEEGTISITFHPGGIKALGDREFSGDAA